MLLNEGVYSSLIVDIRDDDGEKKNFQNLFLLLYKNFFTI
jgi:hypothetical protein